MTQMQPLESSIKKAGFPLSVALLIIFITGSLMGLAMVFYANTAVPRADNDLRQAKHSVLIYKSNFNKLPGVSGNPVELSQNDLVGFPSYENGKIKYSGSSSVNNFCLSLDVSDLIINGGTTPTIHYIKSSLDTIYIKKPAGC